ncbi:vitamin B12 ABC transporter substrate-binding protein BtuF [Vibrio mangrovi]|uniref:Vitamin B12-binding protein n=1 Tax=Vibrio mangrovi TaxID=474394 RepID=A0A1Y6ITV8_9VIBR|nr:vitamin B12 ABC transporter substrate-binding protein BtuF [Vibrio mangrovi]MDW6001723.1 vitamin B12 ABC transporter substrate-binding protein BtuF [Vibrio mangrovi]SMS00250.1 Vitamin B12-binding protein precursor [Vibrio mangrovi]
MFIHRIHLLLLLMILPCLTIAAPPVQRIIALSPHVTELAYAAGLGSKMIAVSDHSDYPPQAQSLPKVANYKGIKIEKVLILKPDLVITWPDGNPPRELQKLQQMGVQTYPSQIHQLSDIADNIEALSQYADNPEIGLENARQFRQQLAALRQRYQHTRKVRFFYQLSEKPIITIARNSWPSEVFEFCGGENVFKESAAPYPQVSREQVLLAQPEVIFNSHHAIKNMDMWSDWSRIPAVRQHHVWTLHSDWLNRPTPRTIRAIKEICQYLDTARQNN